METERFELSTFWMQTRRSAIRTTSPKEGLGKRIELFPSVSQTKMQPLH